MTCENIVRIFLILSLFSSGEACDIPESQKHGDWFCPPSTDPATCHLECHPGYVSTNATVITCQQHQWTKDPECITAVAIITGGEGLKVMENTVEVYGEKIHKKLPNLPESRYSHSLTLVNSVLLLCGGPGTTRDGQATTTSCLSLTASLQWTTHSTTTTFRYSHSSVSMLGQLYLLGGSGDTHSSEHLTPPSQDWISGWKLLEDTYSACAAKIEPEVFIVIGGLGHPSHTVAYNVTSGAATRLKDLNFPRKGHGCSLFMDSNMRDCDTSMRVGAIVVRNDPEWPWGDQDGGPGSKGTVTSVDQDGWIRVKWENGDANHYRYGSDRKFEVKILCEFGGGKGVLVAGGYHRGNYPRESEIYDVKNGEWSTTGNLTMGNEGVRLVVLGNKILAMGGSKVSTVENFNLTSRQWSVDEEMMETRGWFAVTGVPSTTVGIATN